MLVDTHCHVDDPRYDVDRAAMLARAGGVRILVPGTHAAQWSVLRERAASWGVAFGVGTHPRCLGEGREVPRDLDGAVAIGECGLDGPTPVPMDEQVRVLEGHLALSRESGLPVLLHCYRAHHVMLPLLQRWAPVRGVMHSYSGGAELVAGYLAAGVHLSFAGAITYDNARKPLNALRRVPVERLLAETDGPDQCPRPERGRNEPAFLVHVVEAMERARGEPLRARLAANARELLGL